MDVGVDDVALLPVAVGARAVLERLVQLYRYDFASIRGYELDEQGLIEYPFLDRYFVDPHREACFIRYCGKLAGFTMTSEIAAGRRSVSEFFVVRHHRRHGVGRRAAHALFRRHPGLWVLQFDAANHEASAFWPRVVAEIATGAVDAGSKPATAMYPGTELHFEVARRL
jgi:predicted acetyltransferase